MPTKVEGQDDDSSWVNLQIGGIHAAITTANNNLYTFGCGSDGIASIISLFCFPSFVNLVLCIIYIYYF